MGRPIETSQNLMSLDALAAALVEMGRHLHARNLLAGCDGNLSARLSDDEILITPSQRSKIFLNAREMARIRADGTPLVGNPSSERFLHTEIYRRCPKARVVIHAHPPTAIAWTLAFPDANELPSDLLPEVILGCGRIPIAPYARPGTLALPASLEAFLPDSRIILLARHGAVAWGETPEEAYYGIERAEHVATILMKALQCGMPSPLPPDEVDALQAARAQMDGRIF